MTQRRLAHLNTRDGWRSLHGLSRQTPERPEFRYLNSRAIRAVGMKTVWVYVDTTRESATPIICDGNKSPITVNRDYLEAILSVNAEVTIGGSW
jgi:hypothetical protein